MRITLTVTEGAHKGRAFRFSGHDTFLVGRSKRAHLPLPPTDRFCSRFHFLIEINPPHCRLMDLGSNNGTQVNGQRVQTAELHDGDEIRAARQVLRRSVATGADEEAMPEVPGSPVGPETTAFRGGPVVRLPLGTCPGCGSATLPEEGVPPTELALAGTTALCPAC